MLAHLIPLCTNCSQSEPYISTVIIPNFFEAAPYAARIFGPRIAPLVTCSRKDTIHTALLSDQNCIHLLSSSTVGIPSKPNAFLIRTQITFCTPCTGNLARSITHRSLLVVIALHHCRLGWSAGKVAMSVWPGLGRYCKHCAPARPTQTGMTALCITW